MQWNCFLHQRRNVGFHETELSLASINRAVEGFSNNWKQINLLVALTLLAVTTGWSATLSVDIQQITFGPKHHFFGYIGQCQTIPWNESGRYIVGLRADFQDHMPGPNEPADVILIDTHNNYTIRVVDQTRAWNPQQGTGQGRAGRHQPHQKRAQTKRFFEFGDNGPEGRDAGKAAEKSQCGPKKRLFLT